MEASSADLVAVRSHSDSSERRTLIKCECKYGHILEEGMGIYRRFKKKTITDASLSQSLYLHSQYFSIKLLRAIYIIISF